MADLLLVSTRKGLFAYAREAGTWRVQRKAFLGENVTLALATPQREWYAALNLGHFGVKLKYSPDQGRSWHERAVPAYPEGEMVVTGDGKPPRPAILQLIWALETGGPTQPGRLWAGTLPGGLFRSDNGGESWELLRGLWDHPSRQKWFGGGYDVPGIHSICIDPRNPRMIRLAISCGGVWLSDDEGQTWTVHGKGLRAGYMPPELQGTPEIQDPHRMVQCLASPDNLWIQHHSGIFRSQDGGMHWTELSEVSPSTFGFGVAVHPKNPNTAWFVPATKDEQRIPVEGRLVVTRTRDGGATFSMLHHGLPESNAYDLVYRHGLAVDSTGNRLAIGSTTGGLWLSEDQGESWQQLPERLPPIHAVLFA